MAIGALLADDHRVLRDGLHRLLEADGEINVVGTARDGLEAIDEAERLRPDVIVMDISMPRLNGIEATRLIIDHAPGIGIVVLSMHGAEDLVRQALSAGARGFVQKECAGDEVVAAVNTVAAGGRYLGNGIRIKGPALRRGADPGTPTLQDLTRVEREILKLVVDGKSNAEAARALGLSPRTVETYRSRLMEKLQLEHLPALVRYAIRHGLCSVD